MNGAGKELLGIPGILGIDHIGIAVADLDSAITYYQTHFGAQLILRETNEGQRVHEAMVKVGNSVLQLLAPSDSSSTIAKFLETKGAGVQQIAYTVTNLTAACEAARTLGMRVLYDEAQRGTAGSRVNFLHPKDCGGVLVELVEAKK
jgi:methylmalonyl-CoA/ethylmalonyl-CoA epimerase